MVQLFRHDEGMNWAYISSPANPMLNLGPLSVHWYGIWIAIGTIVGVTLTHRRFIARGGDENQSEVALILAIALGIVGARLWHVVTQFGVYRDNPSTIFSIWNGGLAIFGALIGGFLGVVIALRKNPNRIVDFLDAVAPALPIAQAIGRLGNYFNQELYGKPTNLPWGLRIDPAHRNLLYPDSATFHPMFLYEAVLNLILAWTLLKIDQKKLVPRGALILLYFTGYGFIRMLMELLRIDRRYAPFDWTVNGYISLGIFLVSGIASLIVIRRARSQQVSKSAE